MTKPWSKLPRALAGDPRVVLLTAGGELAYWRARVLADDAGALWCVGNRDAVATLAGVLAGKLGAERALAAVRECIDAGLLESEGGSALRVVDWLDDGADTGEGASAPGRAPGRPRHGAAVMTPAERKARFKFEHRRGPFREVPPGLTWEQWHAIEGGTKPWNETTPGWNENVERGNETLERNSGVSPRAFPESGEIRAEGEREERENPDARAGTKPWNETTPRAERNSGEWNETPSRLSSVEIIGGGDLDGLLDRMREASGDRLALMVNGTSHTRAFGDLVRPLIARGATSTEGLVRAAGHAAHDAWFTAQGKLGLHRLMANDGKLLLDLITGAATCPDCGGKAIVAAKAVRARPVIDPTLADAEGPRATPEELAEMRRAAGLPPARPAPHRPLRPGAVNGR